MRGQAQEYDLGDGRATLKDVYEVAKRIEDKIDKGNESIDKRFSGLEQRVANIEGRSAVVAIAWSTIVAIVSIIFEKLVLK